MTDQADYDADDLRADDLDTDDLDPDDADDADIDELLERQWEALGLPPPVYEDERLAPEVDFKVLHKLVRRELPDQMAAAAFKLVYTFRSWSFAHARVLMEEAKRSRQADLFDPTADEH
ncbi:MAG: hypothetical protein WD847_09915 [Pirellulales bacterium]